MRQIVGASLARADAGKAIRGDSLNRTPHILAMTANGFDEDRQTCLAAGMNDHIGKPISPDQMFETLLKWLAQNREGVSS